MIRKPSRSYKLWRADSFTSAQFLTKHKGFQRDRRIFPVTLGHQRRSEWPREHPELGSRSPQNPLLWVDQQTAAPQTQSSTTIPVYKGIQGLVSSLAWNANSSGEKKNPNTLAAVALMQGSEDLCIQYDPLAPSAVLFHYRALDTHICM